MIVSWRYAHFISMCSMRMRYVVAMPKRVRTVVLYAIYVVVSDELECRCGVILSPLALP